MLAAISHGDETRLLQLRTPTPPVLACVLWQPSAEGHTAAGRTADCRGAAAAAGSGDMRALGCGTRGVSDARMVQDAGEGSGRRGGAAATVCRGYRQAEWL